MPAQVLLFSGNSVSQRIADDRLILQRWNNPFVCGRLTMSTLKESGDISTHASGTKSAAVSTVVGPQRETWTFQTLTYRELKRRFWHMCPGMLACGLLVVSHADPISPALRWIVVSCCVVIAAWILQGFRQIQRQGEGA